MMAANSQSRAATRPLLLLLVLTASAGLLLRGARAQSTTSAAGTCPITAAQLTNADYSQVKPACTPQRLGAGPPCAACLCSIGSALFSALAAQGVDVGGELASADEAALQSLFQSCQLTLATQLVDRAGLDVRLLTQLLGCAPTSVTRECIAGPPAAAASPAASACRHSSGVKRKATRRMLRGALPPVPPSAAATPPCQTPPVAGMHALHPPTPPLAQ
eukprot:XP_001699194.1 predicted protein [Chlamydomonas reinhardtii]